MRHLLVCDEYPPAPGAGIGAYAANMAELLARAGETVHVVAPLTPDTVPTEENHAGRLIVHRFDLQGRGLRGLLNSSDLALARQLEGELASLGFAWASSRLCELLIEQEGIDVVEGQEYGGLLYFFQLRRALGLGPSVNPPVVVHLHSPTEFIARFNGWDIHAPQITRRERIEGFSICAADRLLCPSSFLASRAAEHYGIPRPQIEVIAYPTGSGEVLNRPDSVWSSGTILFVGRLEPRKGVIEWVDAAVEVAREYAGLRFELIGPDRPYRDGLTMRQVLRQRIPESLEDRFRFYGEVPRAELTGFMIRCRIAVVPSLWDNFPNSCVEAMSSGVPVLATREGGMAEMIRDGESGWLAAAPSAPELATALRRALQTAPGRLMEMGRQAAWDIEDLCNDEKVLQRQLTFRSELVSAGADRSLRMPAAASGRGTSGVEFPEPGGESGIGVVLAGSATTQDTLLTLQSVERLADRAAAVAVVGNGLDVGQFEGLLEQATGGNWIVLPAPQGEYAAAQNEAIERLLAHDPNIGGFAFPAPGEILSEEFSSVTRKILSRCPEVGLVSVWFLDSTGSVTARPNPSFPYQWINDEAACCSVIRTSAWRFAGGFARSLSSGFDLWDLHNAVMLAGWKAVSVPLVLADCSSVAPGPPADSHVEGAMHELVLRRFEGLSDDARAAILLAGAPARHSMPPVSPLGKLQRRIEGELMAHLPQGAVRTLQTLKRDLSSRLNRSGRF